MSAGSIATEIDYSSDFRSYPKNGSAADIAVGPVRANIVAKVPKGAAANFPPTNETSNNRRSIGLQTRRQNRL
jgi:hypothetical protein